MDSLMDLIRKFSQDNPLFKKMQNDPLSNMSPEMKATMTPKKIWFLNLCGLLYFYSVSSALLLCSLYWTLPAVYSDDSDLFWNRATISTLFFIEVYVNLFLTHRNRGFYTESVRQSLQIIPDPMWKKCLDCDHMIPPRAHHCSLCGKCVLRRDHHCFFAGVCVGYANQRYFMVFVFYCMLAALYALYVTWTYMAMMYTAPYPVSWQFYHYLLPITTLEWMFGYATIDFLGFLTLAYLAAMTGFGSAGIFFWQFITVAQGITSNEFWKGTKCYQQTILQNFRDVFGSYWLLNFIIPMPFFKTPGNGVEWCTSKYH